MSEPTQKMIDDLEEARMYLPEDLEPSLKSAIAILCEMDDSLISDDTELEYVGNG